MLNYEIYGRNNVLFVCTCAHNLTKCLSKQKSDYFLKRKKKQLLMVIYINITTSFCTLIEEHAMFMYFDSLSKHK